MLRSYVVAADRGFAPNPYGGVLTLACCKPRIRSAAAIGSWILGTHRKAVNAKAVCFLAQVSEVTDFASYSEDSRFDCKDPSHHADGDRIYRRNKNGHLIQIRNRYHGPNDYAHDTSTNRILICNNFWYFGSNIVEIPVLFSGKLIKIGQGHKNINDDTILHDFIELISEYSKGMSGDPLDSGYRSIRTCVGSCNRRFRKNRGSGC